MEYYKNTNKFLSSIPKELITKKTLEVIGSNDKLTTYQKQALTPIIVTSKDFNDFFRNKYQESTRYIKRLYNVPLLALGNISARKNLSYIVLPLYYIYQFQAFLARETNIVLDFSELKPPKNLDRVFENSVKFGQGTLENTLHIQNKIYLKNDSKVLYYETKNQILPFETL